jgi:chromosomal replication initiation ATPase DnaA
MTLPTQPETIVAALSIRGLLDLLDFVCARRGVTRSELCGRARTQAVAAARHELWWLIRNHPERRYSYPEIARIVGRDTATVMHGIAAHQRRQRPALVTPDVAALPRLS